MIDLVVYILVCICIILAGIQAFRWYSKYSSLTHQSFKEMQKGSMLIPKFLNSDSEVFDNSEVKVLNRMQVTMYLFMILGIGIIIIHSILY